MISIQNNVNDIDITNLNLKEKIEKILNFLNYKDYDIGLLLTNNSKIQDLNKKYRDKDKPTDILSFPYHTELKAGDRIEVFEEEDKNLGDMIISLEYVVEDAKKLNTTFHERMDVLLVHGICHLLGYDHIIDEDYIVMNTKEKEILKHLNS